MVLKRNQKQTEQIDSFPENRTFAALLCHMFYKFYWDLDNC